MWNRAVAASPWCGAKATALRGQSALRWLVSPPELGSFGPRSFASASAIHRMIHLSRQEHC
jgi:hypothetical protein